MAQDTFNPFADPVLSAYLANVRAWHGYIRFLGLPHLRENPDVVIDRLFVEPRLADRYVSPDSPPKDWPETKTTLEVVPEHRRLVLLGDPGSGKSTLVNWLVWQLAQQTENDWTRRLGRLIPIPMVLREMHIGRGITWMGLLQAFLEHDMAKPLRDTPRLEELLECGQALIVLDGLDEIGAVEVRKDLRDAVFTDMKNYPNRRWLLTSRIVGYEDVPFNRLPAEPGQSFHFGEALSELGCPLAEAVRSMAAVRYVVPFTDDQIARFARNWFTLREAVGSKAEQGAQDLIESIQRDPSTLRLARIPNLLTMMALIHRVRARLPHGRALLYNEITQAYLQSIDEFRGLREVDYPLAQKKRWLARVGFEMQRRRLADAKREILAEKSKVKTWIMEAMAESGYGRDEKAAADFVAYIGLRSGLLLPRGPEQFAFMHLSFQEYFAACFLAEQVTSPQWIRHGKAAPGADREALQGYTREVIWRETLVFLFELLADQPGWPQTLVEDLFGEDFKDLDPEVTEIYNAGVLLARLIADPHSGFSQDMRNQALGKCAELEIALQQKNFLRAARRNFWAGYAPEIVRILFSAEPDQLIQVWDALVSEAKQVHVRALVFGNCKIRDITPLAELNLLWLYLGGTEVSNLRPLSKLTNLQALYLGWTRVSDLTPLSTLINLRTLDITGTAVSDLTPLSTLTNLELLYLGGTKASDLTPLSTLTNLVWLNLSETGVSEEQIASLKKHLPRLEKIW